MGADGTTIATSSWADVPGYIIAQFAGAFVGAIILFMGNVSGAHLNPAVSIAFAARARSSALAPNSIATAASKIASSARGPFSPFNAWIAAPRITGAPMRA